MHLVSNLRNIFPLLNLFGAGEGEVGVRLKQPLLSVFYWSPKNGKMVTSVDRRNFVSVACSATKSKLCPFSFLNFPVMYLRTVEKQKRGTKNSMKTPKKIVCSKSHRPLPALIRTKSVCPEMG